MFYFYFCVFINSSLRWTVLCLFCVLLGRHKTDTSATAVQVPLHDRNPNSKSLVARCVRVARHFQKAGPLVVEHQDISSNDDVFAERLG
jgi:hypothetical protein